ncbi:hypothetical protein AB0F18_00330 [Streptomyces sp. NPDC029216]|uniref:hypothetical protein n=1 Tax=Streptomyces sp. NPDC029216 TaxID=3154701 RepID=UPI0033C70842
MAPLPGLHVVVVVVAAVAVVVTATATEVPVQQLDVQRPAVVVVVRPLLAVVTATAGGRTGRRHRRSDLLRIRRRQD